MRNETKDPGTPGSPHWTASVATFGAVCLSVATAFGVNDWTAGLGLFGGLIIAIAFITPRQ